LGIGQDTKSQTTTTFTSEDTTLAAVYASISAIATSAGGSTVGGIIALDFTHVNGYIQIPTAFVALQGSYYAESNDASNIIVGTRSDANTSIKFCTGTSLEAALNGDYSNAEISGNEFTISVSGGIWIIIKSVNSLNSSLNRNYAFYRTAD
jgi:hypothetical protein